MARRRLNSNVNFNKLFADLDPDDDELSAVRDCFRSLEIDPRPQDGFPFTYSGYPGEHWLVRCRRFAIIYQFSETEVRPKDIQLWETWE